MKKLALDAQIKEVLLNNDELLMESVRAINSYNGALDEFDVFEFDEANEYLHGKEPVEIMRMVQFGDVHWTDEYLRFNGYGNLESISEYSLIREMKEEIDEIVYQLIEEVRGNAPTEISEIMEAYRMED